MSQGRFLHTMLRVGNLDKSVDFYTRLLGMKELRRRDGLKQKEAKEKIWITLQPVLDVRESAPSLKRVESNQPELLP